MNYDQDIYDEALSLFESQKYEQASELFDTLIIQAPTNVDFLDFKARCLMTIGVQASGSKRNKYIQESVNFFDLLLSIDPKKDIKELRDSMVNLLEVYDSNDFEDVTQADIDNDDAKQTIRELLKNNEYEKAILHLDKYIQNNPDDSNSYFLKGVSLGLLDDHVSAIKCYDMTLKLDPNVIDTVHYNFRYSQSLFCLEKYDDSLRFIDKALDIDPNDVESLYSKATILSILGGEFLTNEDSEPKDYFKQSLNCFDKVLKLDPTHEAAQTGKNRLMQMINKL